MMADELVVDEQLHREDAVDGGAPMPSFEDGSVSKMETSSDIIIEEEERCPSRASSPEIEVLEVLKSTTRITVDLTGDDESQDEFDSPDVVFETRRPTPKTPSYTRPQASGSAPDLDISSVENVNLIPEIRQLSTLDYAALSANTQPQRNSNGSSGYYSTTSNVQSMRESCYEGHLKRLRPASMGVKQEQQEDSDTLSMMLELEAFMPSPQPGIPMGDNPDTKNFLDCNGIPSFATSNVEFMLTGSSSGAMLSHGRLSPGLQNSSGYSDRHGKSLSGPSHSGNFPCDMPLNMSVSSASVSKEHVPNPSATSLTVPCLGSASHSENPLALVQSKSSELSHASTSSNRQLDDIVDLTLPKTGLNSEFKTPLPSHPNSAFQAVTPSTSSSTLPEPMSYVNNSQLPDPLSFVNNSQPAVTSNTGVDSWNGHLYSSTSNVGDGTLVVNSNPNFWNSPSVPNTRSNLCNQFLENALSSLLGTIAPQVSATYSINNSSSGQELGFTISSNSEAPSGALHSTHYSVAGPSTANDSYSQGVKSNLVGFVDKPVLSPSQHITTSMPSVLPILSPNTIIEQTSSFNNSSLQSFGFASTSHKLANAVAHISEENKTSTQSTSDSRPAEPLALEEPTFSCNICLDSLKSIQSSSRNLCSTVCGHVFCSACLEAALKRKKECPMCRKRLGKKQYHPLFL